MNRTEKEQLVAELHKELEAAPHVVLVDFRGLSVPAATEFRRKVEAAGSRYRVVKNRLALRAAKGTPLEKLDTQFEGTTGIAWTGEDSYVISFTDVAVPEGGLGMESESDIRAIVDGVVTSAFEDIDYNQINGGLVYNPNAVKMKVKNVTLGIKSPAANVCPGIAKLSVFFRANKKGKISFLLVRKNGSVSGPYSVQTKKYGNEYRASYTKVFNVQTPINTMYRAVVTHSGKKASRWVPLKASC